MRLVADKKLRLDDAVSKFVTDWPVDKAGITLDDLVRHSSGLPGEVAWAKSGANTSRAALQAIAALPLVERPGRAVAYSAVNSNLLALVLEAASQQRFEKLLVDLICKPFGMTTAGPCNARADPKLVSFRRSPQNERGEPATTLEWNQAQRGARGVLASVLDVHALLSGLTAGKLIDDERLALLWRPSPPSPGYEVSALPGNGETLVRVAGQTGGYRARWIVHRSSKSWVVLLTEDYGSQDDLEAALVAELSQLRPATTAAVPAVGDGKPPAAPTGEPPAGGAAVAGWPLTQLERFVGTFVMPRGGGTFVIDRDGDALRLRGAGLQASVRVAEGHWPPAGEDRLRSFEDRGLRLLERLVADEAAVDGEGFADSSSGAAARQLLREWKQRHGVPTTVEYVGSRLTGAGESWFRLALATQQLVLHVTWANESRWRRCEVGEQPPPFAVALTSVRADCAVAETAAGRRLVLTIEGQGASRRLVFEDESTERDGLLECEWRDSKAR